MTAIIQYNAGNIRSVANALQRLNTDFIISDNPHQIRAAQRVILPGVGAAGMAMSYLRDKRLDITLAQLTQPVLGICLGLQLMCTYTEEDETTGLGIFNTSVRKLPPTDRVPHTGWNNLNVMPSPLLEGIKADDDVYFVHSYAAELGADTIATSDYILPFSAALNRKNFYATQFHPEKSGNVGERILQNFLTL